MRDTRTIALNPPFLWFYDLSGAYVNGPIPMVDPNATGLGSFWFDGYDWPEAYELPPADLPADYNGISVRKRDNWDCWRRQIPDPPSASGLSVAPYDLELNSYWGDAAIFQAYAIDGIMPVWYQILDGLNEVVHRNNLGYPLADDGTVIHRWLPNLVGGIQRLPRLDAFASTPTYPTQFLVIGTSPLPPEYQVFAGIMFDWPGMCPVYCTGDGSRRLFQGVAFDPSDVGNNFELGDRVDYNISLRAYVRVDINATVHPPTNPTLNPNDTYRTDRFGYRISWGSMIKHEIGPNIPETRIRYPWSISQSSMNMGSNPPNIETILWNQANANGWFTWGQYAHRDRQDW